MLLIRVVSFRERPVGRELTARFEEAGGTIGRGENSTLVLPDPERRISRTHATIAFQASGFNVTTPTSASRRRSEPRPRTFLSFATDTATSALLSSTRSPGIFDDARGSRQTN